MVSGRPNWANSTCNSSITAADVADGVLIASIHLECASTMTRYRTFSPSLAQQNQGAVWPMAYLAISMVARGQLVVSVCEVDNQYTVSPSSQYR